MGFYLGGFVQQDDVAELNLLDNQILYVVLVQILIHQAASAGELVLHSEGVHHGYDAVKQGYAVLGDFGGHGGDGADGLCDGSGLADTAGLDDDIVKALHGDDVMQLLYQVHLQGAADAAVLQGYEAVVGLVDDAAFLDKVGVDVHFADVVDDYGKAYAFLVGENAVQQCGLTAAQISCEQQYGDVILIHRFDIL